MMLDALKFDIMIDEDKEFIESVVKGDATSNYVRDYIAESKAIGKICGLYESMTTEVLLKSFEKPLLQSVDEVLKMVEFAKLEYEQGELFVEEFGTPNQTQIESKISELEKEISELEKDWQIWQNTANDKRAIELLQRVGKGLTLTSSETAFLNNYREIVYGDKRNASERIKQKQALLNWLKEQAKASSKEARNNNQPLSSEQSKAIEKAKELGFITNGEPPYEWNAEVYKLGFFVAEFWEKKWSRAQPYFKHDMGKKVRQSYESSNTSEQAKFVKQFKVLPN